MASPLIDRTPDTANELYFDLQLQHQIGIRRLSSGVIREMIQTLSEADVELVVLLRTRLAELSGGLPAFDSLQNKIETERYQKLRRSIVALRTSLWKKIKKEGTADLVELAEHEADFELTILGKATPVRIAFSSVSIEQLRAATVAKPFGGGFGAARTLEEWFDSVAATDQTKLINSIRQGIVQGKTIQKMVQEVAGTRAAQFTDGILATSRRNAETIVRTGVNHVSNAAREAIWEANHEVISAMRWTATLDGRTSAICRSRDGAMAPTKGNKIPAGARKLIPPGARPPAHPNCLPGDSLVTTRSGIAGATKRWFEGEMITIRTAGNHEVTCTPNHPVLTQRGWVAAKLVNQRDRVVRDDRSQLPLSWSESKYKQVPTKIEELAATFLECGPVFRTMSMSDDFHGDGTDGEVCVVGVNGGLSVKNNSLIETEFLEKNFEGGLSFSSGLFGPRGLPNGLLGADTTPNSLMSSSRLDGPFCNSSFSPDFFAGDRGFDSFSGFFPPDPRSLLLVSGDSSFGEEPSHRELGTTDSLGYILDRFSTQVSFDDVVLVSKKKFNGHVFNLDTEEGWYSAGEGGIIVHNCRSVMIAMLFGQGLSDMAGERPFVRDTRTRRFREKDFRAESKQADPQRWAQLDRSGRNALIRSRREKWMNENVGRVPATIDYDAWLRQQPDAFQDGVLGKRKAAKFREGLSLDRYVDENGRELTLKQFKALGL